MMKIKIMLLIIILSGFTVHAQRTKRINFSTFESIQSKNKVTFCLEVPRNYNEIRLQGDTHLGLKVKAIHYSDSSIIYIGDNTNEGSILNWQNKINGGYLPLTKNSELDTLSMHGKQWNGNFWKEEI
ncbi:MAG TPA: hypothetical protein VFU05_01975, partial [Cyclobacteriaceae bacterium]|nr:hypothetical protein [Cyclobacteriaceae bacterium]